MGFGVDASGRAIVAGYTSASSGRTAAVRFLPTGERDASYGTVFLGLDGLVEDIVVKRDGSAYFLSWDDWLTALDPQGRQLPGFGLDIGPDWLSDRPRTLAAGPGGTLLIAGQAGSRAGFIARVRADGQPDRRFGDGGVIIVQSAAINAIARDRRGRLVAAGDRHPRDYKRDAAVLRFSARGRLDRSFGSRGIAVKRLGLVRGVNIVSSTADHVAIDDRGRIVIAGQSYDDEFIGREDQGQSYPAIARLQG
ncbi:hypothetical protein [Solirubrobacter soli]|uniref:hypothetical protein n=1 Tax=Solirubrobacter soli TaxID=363832 RepID=UPI00041199AE|nr:hypothetical protein [Solirubrobacter soli]